MCISGWAGCTAESKGEETKRKRQQLTSPVSLHWALARLDTANTMYLQLLREVERKIEINIVIFPVENSTWSCVVGVPTDLGPN